MRRSAAGRTLRRGVWVLVALGAGVQAGPVGASGFVPYGQRQRRFTPGWHRPPWLWRALGAVVTVTTKL